MATETDANECLQCNCNGKSHECYFNQTLYDLTGHGGYCINCRDNTAGPNCDQCKVNHYLKKPEHMCMPCNCDATGSTNLQCDFTGKCRCKPGVTGVHCDRCKPNHYDFSAYGCRSCDCDLAGSFENQPHCDTITGKCRCKANVEGQKCDRCKIGFFGMEESNPFGCIACFCYGHSSSCQSANGYYGRSTVSLFDTGRQRWKAVDRANVVVNTQFNAITRQLGVAAQGREFIYFVAPDRYLGDRRFSYNQFLSFKFRIGENQARASRADIVLEGGNGQMVSLPIYAQKNPVPKATEQEYRFRLHEHADYEWQPHLLAEDFITLLSNLTAIKIRGTYNTDGTGFLDDVKMGTAWLGFNGGKVATWVEQCNCPTAYLGEYCQSCSPGYRRDPPNGGPFARCVPCECNGHSDDCDVNTGRCICKHNTIGRNCERCLEGYYGDARQGTTDDCKQCPCPNNGTCQQFSNKEVVCTNCPDGYGGDLCNICLDGYYGDPAGRHGPKTPCQRCSCNDNIDLNSVGNCNTITGECLNCRYNTVGFFCEKCLPNYYGDALALPKGQCKPCNCYEKGTLPTGTIFSCDPNNGQCPCQNAVEGLKCDKCQPGYWNLDSGSGCEPCNCDLTGSIDSNCDQNHGQCTCKDNTLLCPCLFSSSKSLPFSSSLVPAFLLFSSLPFSSSFPCLSPLLFAFLLFLVPYLSLFFPAFLLFFVPAFLLLFKPAFLLFSSLPFSSSFFPCLSPLLNPCLSPLLFPAFLLFSFSFLLLPSPLPFNLPFSSSQSLPFSSSSFSPCLSPLLVPAFLIFYIIPYHFPAFLLFCVPASSFLLFSSLPFSSSRPLPFSSSRPCLLKFLLPAFLLFFIPAFLLFYSLLSPLPRPCLSPLLNPAFLLFLPPVPLSPLLLSSPCLSPLLVPAFLLFFVPAFLLFSYPCLSPLLIPCLSPLLIKSCLSPLLSPAFLLFYFPSLSPLLNFPAFLLFYPCLSPLLQTCLSPLLQFFSPLRSSLPFPLPPYFFSFLLNLPFSSSLKLSFSPFSKESLPFSSSKTPAFLLFCPCLFLFSRCLFLFFPFFSSSRPCLSPLLSPENSYTLFFPCLSPFLLPPLFALSPLPLPAFSLLQSNVPAFLLFYLPAFLLFCIPNFSSSQNDFLLFSSLPFSSSHPCLSPLPFSP
ncbi:LAMC1 [Acanthosepion pharaonis]|uniref:LAMC1 n=1 Tax=Acanthosepion pharaonis TaxID=158019 RepID=A0A812D1E5_ACAPH|nr:LAMC1 [Sepia pharaonis]